MRSVKRGVVKHLRRGREMSGKRRVMSRWGNAPAVQWECLDWDLICLRLSTALFLVSPSLLTVCVSVCVGFELKREG